MIYKAMLTYCLHVNLHCTLYTVLLTSCIEVRRLDIDRLVEGRDEAMASC